MYTYLVVSTHQRQYDKCSHKAGGSALTARSHADFGHQRNESRVGVKRKKTGQRDPLLQVASKTKTGQTQTCDWQGKAWQAIFPPLCNLKYGFVPSLHHFMGPSSQLWGWTWRTKKRQSVFHCISMIIWSLKNDGCRASMWVFKGK